MRQVNQINRLYITLLSLIIIFHAVNNFIWLKMDNIPKGVDVSCHLTQALVYHTKINKISFSPLSFWEKLNGFAGLLRYRGKYIWPSLFHILMACLNISGNFSTFWLRFDNIYYFIILILSTYLIASKCLNEKAGLLAAFLISFYPAVYGLSRQFGLDFPLMAMVGLSVYALLKTENFKSVYYSILFGIILGLGMLIKMQIIIFLVGPLIYMAYRVFLAPVLHRKKVFWDFKNSFNFIFSLFIAGVISSIWWFGHIKELNAHFLRHTLTQFPIDPSLIPLVSGPEVITPFTFKWILFYFIQTVANINPFFFALFAFSVFYFRRLKMKKKPVIILWVIIPYLIFTLLFCKWGRYFFPAFPAIAIITSCGVIKIEQRFFKQVIIFFIVIIALLQFFKFSYGFSFIPDFKLHFNYPVRIVEKYSVPERSVIPELINNISLEISRRTSSPPSSLRIGVFGDWRQEIAYFLKLRFPHSIIWQSDDMSYLEAKKPQFIIGRMTPESFQINIAEISKDYHIIQKDNIGIDDLTELTEFLYFFVKKRTRKLSSIYQLKSTINSLIIRII